MLFDKVFTKSFIAVIGALSMLICQPVFSEDGTMGTLKKSLDKGNYLFGVFIYSKTFDRFSSNPSALAKKCSDYGFNCVWLSVKRKEFRSSEAYRKNISKAVEEFHSHKIKVNALVFNDAVPYFDTVIATEEIKGIAEYNKSVEQDRRFDGITSDLEPNSLKEGKINFPENFSLRWSKEGFNTGNDNNKIMIRTMNILKDASKQAATMPFSQTMNTSFTKDVLEKRLAVGSVNDFLGVCSYLIEMAYFDTAKKVYNSVKTDLRLSDHKESIVICVKVKEGSTPDNFAYMSKKEFAGALSELIDKASEFSSFKGMAVYDYEGMENIITSE